MKIDPGTIAEYRFAYAATLRGFIVSWPAADKGYDFVIDNGKTLLKIQVKSVNKKNQRRKAYQIVARRGSVKRAYKCGEIDFLAAYVSTLDTFYLIPIKHVDGITTLNLYPHRTGVGKFESFKENWSLMR